MNQPQNSKRPTVITILCVFGFITGIFVIPLALSDNAQSIGPWYPPVLIAGGVVGFICHIGFWLMRKWAVWTYVAFVIVNQIIFMVQGVWSPLALIIPAIYISIIAIYYKRMR